MILEKPSRPLELVVYLDESGTSGRDDFMIIAGYIAKKAQWAKLHERWGRLLRRSKLEFSHAVDLWGRRGAYRHWTTLDQDRFVQTATRIVDQTTLCGFSVRLNYSDYETYYRSGEKPKKLHLDSAYGICFRFCLAFLPDFVVRSLNRQDVVLHFILEDGHKNVNDAVRIFNQTKKELPEVGRFLGEISVEAKASHSGLQVADLTASSALKNEASPSLVDFPQGGRLSDARRIVSARSPVFRCHATSDILRELKQGGVALVEARRRYWAEGTKRREE